MPILIHPSGEIWPCRLFEAKSVRQRLLGFLALAGEAEPKALLIRRCNGIHTFSMDRPLGVAFLDRAGRVLRVEERLHPGRMIPRVRGAGEVLEWDGAATAAVPFHAGDRLELTVDAVPAGGAGAWRQFLHGPANLFLALLWLAMVVANLTHWFEARNLTGVGLFCYNSLIAYLFFTRRSSAALSRNGLDWLVALATVVLSFSLRPAADPSPHLQHISLALQSAALAAVVYALASLGRSFGVVPANRSVKTGGAYRLIRHPLYAAELAFLAAFLLGNPDWGNIFKSVLITAGQIYRALAEEKLLGQDPRYQIYKSRVRFRFIPYLF